MTPHPTAKAAPVPPIARHMMPAIQGMYPDLLRHPPRPESGVDLSIMRD